MKLTKMNTLYSWLIGGWLILFAISFGVGLLLPASTKLLVLEMVAAKFETILVNSPTGWLLSWNIFVNNLLVCLLLYVGGFMVIVPVLIVMSNGVMLGVFMSLLYRSEVLLPGNLISAVAGLLPHGIFELSAFFLAGALSMAVIAKLLFPKKIAPEKRRRRVLWDSVKWFIGMVVPLLIVAALLETFVSPWVSAWLQRQWLIRKIDPQLVVELSETALVNNDCQPDGYELTISTNTSQTMTETLLFLARLVYDPALYASWQQRADAPFWRQTWHCGQAGYLQVQSWQTADWSVEQATDNLKLMLKNSDTTFDYSINNEQRRFTYMLGDQSVVQSIIPLADKAVVITQTNVMFTLDELIE